MLQTRYFKIFLVLNLWILCFFNCNTSSNTEVQSDVKTLTFESKIQKRAIGYNIYQPKQKDVKNIPILYLLHGHGGNHHDWFDVEEGNIKHILDSLISSKAIPPVIAVSLNAQNSWYVNHENIAMEDIYIKEFIPHIEKHYGNTTHSNKNIIVGNSMGGYGALNYALKYPKHFENVILLAPAAYYPVPPQLSSSRKIPVYKKDDVFNDSIWNNHLYTNIQLKENKSVYPKFYISTGDDDPFQIFDVVVQLKGFFETNKLAHETTVINGKHTWDVWRPCFIQDIIRTLEQPITVE